MRHSEEKTKDRFDSWAAEIQNARGDLNLLFYFSRIGDIEINCVGYFVGPKFSALHQMLSLELDV